MDNHKLFVSINGKMEEFLPPPGISVATSISGTDKEIENPTLTRIKDGAEMSVSFKADENMQRFIEQMREELSVVDITDLPTQMIKKLIVTFPSTSKLVTRNPEHYQTLQMEDGFGCVAGDYDTLFGVPLILDKRGKIKAAQVEFEREGGGTDHGK